MVLTVSIENTVTQVVAIIMGGATLIAYIIGEGLVDSASTELVIDTQIETDEE